MLADRGRLIEAADQLAIQAVMVESHDRAGLGSILDKLETIEKISSDKDQKPARLLSLSLKKVVERIVQNDHDSPEHEMGLFGHGVKLLHHRILNSDLPSLSSQEESYLELINTLSGTSLSLPIKEENKTIPLQASVEKPLDITHDIEIYREFITEALEHLETIELDIINLEQFPDDKECINAIFRPFHTIKGVSGFLNLHEINQLSHAMESLLDLARQEKLQIHRAIIDFILEATDALKGMIYDLKAHTKNGRIDHSSFNITPYLDKIDLFLKGEIPDSSGKRKQVKTDSNGEYPVKGYNIKEIPYRKAQADSFKNPTPPLGEILSSKGVASPAQINDALKQQAEMKTDLKLGQILIDKFDIKPKDVISALRDQKQYAISGPETSVKINTSKLDTLVDLVGELVITQTLVQQNPVLSSLQNQKLVQDFSQLKRITADLQRNSMALRMVPIWNTFHKMIRLVRDLGQKSNKLIELKMEGEDTEIDRNMVDRLYDPLVHMIRNAIDHGIELPEARKGKGKPDSGTILLKAYQKGGHVVIEVEDDGQGLDENKILQKAKDRGLVPEGASLTREQISSLVFEFGLSTTDQVTDVSGRGVGMDVVKKAIENLRGRIEVFSTEGKGCRFVLRIPLTLAILDGIVVRVGQDRFIIPTLFIKETLRPKPGDISTIQKKVEVVQIRNTLVPLLRLNEFLGIASERKEPWESLVVVVENEGRQKCLMVDDLLGKQEVVIKTLGEKLKEVRGIAGATIMGDGRVGLILDIHSIFEETTPYRNVA